MIARGIDVIMFTNAAKTLYHLSTSNVPVASLISDTGLLNPSTNAAPKNMNTNTFGNVKDSPK